MKSHPQRRRLGVKGSNSLREPSSLHTSLHTDRNVPLRMHGGCLMCNREEGAVNRKIGRSRFFTQLKQRTTGRHSSNISAHTRVSRQKHSIQIDNTARIRIQPQIFPERKQYTTPKIRRTICTAQIFCSGSLLQHSLPIQVELHSSATVVMLELHPR